jgi:hypothetical protein
MNYICNKCHVRQAVKDDMSAVPNCDCGQVMSPDVLATDDKARKAEGMYGSK